MGGGRWQVAGGMWKGRIARQRRAQAGSSAQTEATVAIGRPRQPAADFWQWTNRRYRLVCSTSVRAPLALPDVGFVSSSC